MINICKECRWVWVTDFYNSDITAWFCARNGYEIDIVTGIHNYPLCVIERDDSCGACGEAGKYWEKKA